MEEQADVGEEVEPEDDPVNAPAVTPEEVDDGDGADTAVGAEAAVEDVKGKGKESMTDRMARFKDLRARMVSDITLGPVHTPLGGSFATVCDAPCSDNELMAEPIGYGQPTRPDRRSSEVQGDGERASEAGEAAQTRAGIAPQSRRRGDGRGYGAEKSLGVEHRAERTVGGEAGAVGYPRRHAFSR